MSKELDALERVWWDIKIENNFRDDFKDLLIIKEALEEKEKQDKKLSELKDIEDKLGCPLEVMFKLVQQNELYYQFYDELQHWDSLKIDLRKKRVWFCKQVGGHYASYQPLSNYGKTFWLKQNKEE